MSPQTKDVILARVRGVEDYPRAWMIFVTVKTRLTWRDVYHALRAFLAVSSAWTAVLGAEPVADPSATRVQADADSEPVRLPQVPRFELTDPNREAIRRSSFNVPGLHLELRSYGIQKHTVAAQLAPDYRWESGTQLRASLPASWLEGAREPTSIAAINRTAAMPQDERSAWARWHSSMWGASATVGVLMVSMVGVLSLVPKEVSGWNKPNFKGMEKTFRNGPSFDSDHYYFNYIFHPYDGSEFYLIARNRDCNWWQSFAYAAAVSTSFELLFESVYEGASWQDLWITPVSGAVIGELRWQAKKALEDPSTGKPIGTANKILYVIVDPLDAIFNL